MKKPKTFTTREAIMDELAGVIMKSAEPYRVIAEAAGVSTSTVGAIATGRTRWPRPHTIFSVAHVLGYELQLSRLS